MLRFHLLILLLAPLLLLIPPARGTMILLPIMPATSAETINWARRAGGTLVTSGPYAGAMVVNGDRGALAAAALANGALISSASAVGCVPASE